MRTWPLVSFLLLALLTAGCTSTAPAERPPASVPAEVPSPGPEAAPAQPEPLDVDGLDRSGPPRVAYVRGHVLHRPDGSRLTIRLGIRGPWGITSLVPDGNTYLVTDDRAFEGTIGMHRVSADGTSLGSWTSTGPALAARSGAVAWVSLVAPESGESGPTLLHTSTAEQRLSPLAWPVLSRYDGRTVTFTALRQEGKAWKRRGFASDLTGRPHRVPTPSGRTRSPNGRHRWQQRRRVLVIGGPEGEVEVRARPFVQSFSRPTWEDDEHLLVTVTHRRRQAIGRLGLDGTLTLASDWSPSTNAGFAFVTFPRWCGRGSCSPRRP